MIAFSTISVCSTLTVLLTYYLHWDHIAKGKLYPKMIFMIFVSQCLSNLCTVPGYPMTEDACSAQGFLNQYFTRVMWTWCMSLACTLAYKLITGESGLTFFGLNVAIWGSNLLIQCLPMITGDYPGLPVAYLGKGICSIGRSASEGGADWQNPENENLMWYTVTSTAPLFLTVIITGVAVLLIYIRVLPVVGELEDQDSSIKIRRLIRNALPYPVGALVAWTPTLVVAMIVFILVSEENWYLLLKLPLVVPNIFFTLFFTLYGLYITIVFFIFSRESRRRNFNLFKRVQRDFLKASGVAEQASSYSARDHHTGQSPKTTCFTTLVSALACTCVSRPLAEDDDDLRDESRCGDRPGTDSDLLLLQADFEKDDEYAVIVDPLRETLRNSGASGLRGTGTRSTFMSSWGRDSTRTGSMRDPSSGKDKSRSATPDSNSFVPRISARDRFSLKDIQFVGGTANTEGSLSQRPSGLSDIGGSVRMSSTSSPSFTSKASDFIPPSYEL